MKHHRSIALPTIAVLTLLAIPGCASWDVRSESARTPETHTQAQPARQLSPIDQLRALSGTWVAVAPPEKGQKPAMVVFKPTAGGSAVMETMFPGSDREMVNLFTPDANGLAMTHYCSMGNQPQMMTKTIADPSPKSLTFSLSHVYGLRTPGDWHNTGLTLTLDDTQHLTQVWTYEYNGKKGTNTFRFTRTL